MNYKMEYIFIQKQENSFDNFPVSFFKANPDIELWGKNSFRINIENNNHIVDYSYGEYNNDTRFFNISLRAKTINIEKSIVLLESAHKLIYHSRDKGKFHIIVSNDTVSQYYCTKAFPYFISFETTLRNLLLKFFTKAFAEKWINVFIKETIIDEIHVPKKPDEQIKSMMNELNLWQLKHLLFDEQRTDLDNVLDNQLAKINTEKLSKAEILNTLEKIRKKSIWVDSLNGEKYIEDFQTKFEILREHRNKVAHFKRFTKKEFNESISLINEVLPKLEEMSLHVQEIKLTNDFYQGLDEVDDFYKSVGKITVGIGVGIGVALLINMFKNLDEVKTIENINTIN